MSYKVFLLMVSLFLLLFGCSPNDEGEAKLPGDTEQTLSETLERPEIFVGIKDPEEEGGVTYAIRDKSCWEEEGMECNNLQPHDPEELVKGYPTMIVHQEDEISISKLNSDFNTPDAIWDIDELEIIQHFKGEETTVETVDENNGRHTFKAPQEPGRYFFSAILRWNGEIKGEAIFAFSFFVKE
ncbi:hypothetical protein QT711_17320 [Sporosarcina saromensis]|uniref:YtkA-like n=1 Tax=Sporosarcina saromensis TaxID=359365 RepID=A0ABU4GD77_9BACL|nr:hypothetical protein [Sporosarcina saromensis]MDW0114943.1 hypothetical protein [Sporosarcina saromensis]